MAHEQKTQTKQKTFDETLDYYPDEKKVMYPQNDVHTSEDILTKMIKKFPLTLNFFWVVYVTQCTKNLKTFALS